MSYNPFEAPQSDSRVIGILSGTREDLRSVARYQKGVIVCILIYLIAAFGQFAVPPELRIFIGIGIMCVGLTGAVFAFLLAMKTHGTGQGILLGILTLVPCVGLLVLLIINSKATNVLKQNGIKVGLLGADLKSI
jgi:hypothetical protein